MMKNMQPRLAMVVVVAVVAGLGVVARQAAGVNVTLSNVAPRTDVTGAVMDAHDGALFQHTDGLYYWFAASYGNCTEPAGPTGCADMAPGSCGFQFNHNVSLWTSPDLTTWTPAGPVFQMLRDFNGAAGRGVLFCPKVLYNAGTATWVLWFNWIDTTVGWTASYYAVATAPAAVGPWTVVSRAVTSLAYNDTGDFNLMADASGAAYIIYTAHISGWPVTHQMSVEALTADYTATTGAAASSGFFGAPGVEAPALFRAGAVYYAVFGACCCYCASGSPVVVYTAANPLGPYATRNNIGAPGGGNACGGGSSGSGRASRLLAALRSTPGAPAAACALRAAQAAAIPAQQTHIVTYTNGVGVPSYLWIGDRWQSSPNGMKSEDFTYWSPLAFDATGNLTAMVWTDTFTLSVGT